MNTAADHEFFRHVALTDLTLRVGDLAGVAAFYRDVLGFHPMATTGQRVEFSANGSPPALLVLEAAPDAPRRPAASAGLFHAAWLLPDRAGLGRIVRRLHERGIPFGEADHGVSEAIYLQDPEGNGIELYADRPPCEWPPSRALDQVAMFTAPLDLRSLLDVGSATSGPILRPETRLGHVHLSVSQLDAARQFYADVLGFPVRQENYPGALFYGRNGYHHHLATNTWRSQRPKLPEARGLIRFTIRITEEAERQMVVARAQEKRRTTNVQADAALVRDPDGIEIALCSA